MTSGNEREPTWLVGCMHASACSGWQRLLEMKMTPLGQENPSYHARMHQARPSLASGQQGILPWGLLRA